MLQTTPLDFSQSLFPNYLAVHRYMPRDPSDPMVRNPQFWFERPALSSPDLPSPHPRTAPAGASTLRPLARRALSTWRPDALAMRVRNPLVRARLRRVPLSVHPMDLPPATITNAPRPAFFVAAFVFANALDASATRVGAARTRVATARWRCCCCCDDDDAVVVADVGAEATADMQNADIVVCDVQSRVVFVVDTQPSIHRSIDWGRVDRGRDDHMIDRPIGWGGVEYGS